MEKSKNNGKVLSVVVPVFNELGTVEALLQRVFAVEVAGLGKEVVVVDDGSMDGTAAVLERWKDRITLITHSENQGKGVSVRDGLVQSKGDFVVIQDADLEYDPADWTKLLAPIIAGKADVVFGSRFVGSDSHRVLYYWHYLGNRLLTTLSNMLTNLNLTDMETCYKVFTREVVDDIKGKLVSKRFGIEPELTARVKTYRVYEVGISYSGRTYEQGKKIGWRDGFSALYSIVRFNIFP